MAGFGVQALGALRVYAGLCRDFSVGRNSMLWCSRGYEVGSMQTLLTFWLPLRALGAAVGLGVSALLIWAVDLESGGENEVAKSLRTCRCKVSFSCIVNTA